MTHIHDRHTVYLYIADYQHKNGVSPTLREICQACGIGSTNTAVFLLNRLQRDGLIRRIPHISRGIVIVANPSAMD